MREILGTAGEVLALLLSLCAVVGVTVKYVLLPYLEKRFAPYAEKVDETHRQVTVNGHVSPEPTMRDRVDSLATELAQLKGETRADIRAIRDDIGTIGKVYDGHLEWSSRTSHELGRRLRMVERHLRRNTTEKEDVTQ